MQRKWNAGDIPFKLERASGKLSKQMTDGLRQAIASGFFKPGTVLPTILEWTKLLNVSIRVPEAAVSELVKEGYITAQKRLGCIVNAKREEVWRGRILVIVPDGDHVYYHNVMVGRLRSRLAEAGYMFAQVTVLRKANGRYDLKQLDHELRGKPDFALLVGNRREIEHRLSRAGTSFGVFGTEPCRLKGCVVNFHCDNAVGVREFVAHCQRIGVKRVLQVSKSTGGYFDVVPPLLDVGVEATDWQVPAFLEFGRAEGAERGALAAFRERFAREGKSWLPDVLVFNDDFVASGALTAMLLEGVRIPGDVRVVSLANKGLGPVYPVSLTRLENDPYAHGDILADAVVALLKGRQIRGVGEIAPSYIIGESFP